MWNGRVLSAALLASAIVTNVVARSPEYRVMWVSRFEWPSANEATAKANIDNIMQTLANNGFNAVLFQVRGQCDVHYPSPYEPWANTYGWTDPGWDPLAYAIQAAHSRGLEFHAYINTHTLAQGVPPANTTPQHPYNLHGPDVPIEQSWVIRDQNGATATSDNYTWISPGIPEASWWVRRAIMHVVENYDVDGVHFDRIRTPGPQYSYDPITVARFNGDGNPDNLSWADFMRSQITRDLRNIYGEIQWKKKHVKVSAAPFGIVYKDATTNYQGTGTQSYHQWYQDSWGWMNAHVVDFMVPMIYWEVGSSHPFEAILADWLNHAGGRYVVAGSTTNGGTKTASALLAEYQQTVSQNAAGHCIFSFNSMGSYWSTFASGPYASPAALPPMPWKTAPTTGNIVGYVRDRNGLPVVDARVNRVGDSYNYLSAYDGFFAILEVPTSISLTITATKSGKGSATVSGVVVGAGETTVVTLTLRQSQGSIQLNKGQYQFNEIMQIRVTDDDLDGAGQITVQATSASEPAGETVVLYETATSGTFEGSLKLVGTGQVASDGVLKVSIGDTVTITYEDSDQGNGQPGTATATASIISPPPIIIESRTPSGALTPAPAYQEFITSGGSWANTTAKSQAPGLQAPGSRFTSTGSLGAYAVWRPNIMTPGFYDVYITLANATRGPNNYSPGAGFVVQHLNGATSGTFDLTRDNPALVDQWMLLASDVLLGEGTGASLTIINNNPNSASNQRFCMDAVKFVFKGLSDTSAGWLTFDRGKYRVPGSAIVRLVDSDLAGLSETTITVTSSAEPGGEIISLSEDGSSGVFEGTVNFAHGAATAGDGILQVAPSDVVIARYEDADHGNGTPATVTATAQVDGVAPVISNVTVAERGPRRATITFATDEPSTAVLRYGTAANDLSAAQSVAVPAQSFTIQLTALEPSTTYYFVILAQDDVGNVALNDNAGALFTFETLTLTEGLIENFDTQPDGWQKTGLWRLVNSLDSCLTPVSLPHCYHYGRADTCTYNTGATNSGSLISPEFIVPPLGELTFQSREETENTTLWDTRRVYVLADGGATRTQLAQLSGSGWTWYQAGPFDLSAYAGQTIALEFAFDSRDSLYNDFKGWAIDDVVVESADKLEVSTGSLEAIGPQGGSFSPSEAVFTLRNRGTTAIEWGSSTTVDWIAVVSSSGNLAAGEETTVSVALTDAATLLPEGYHAGEVSFFNQATGLLHVRPVSLRVYSQPSAPMNLRATAQGSEVLLTWQDVSANETGFAIECASGAGPFEPLATVDANETSYRHAAPLKATRYRYRVRAFHAWAASEWSNVATAVTPLHETFATGPAGWTLMGTPGASVTGEYDELNQALRLRVFEAPEQRVLGWQSPRLPLTGDPNTIYRFKAYIFRSGQTDMENPKLVPNVRLRCSVRYAMNSMLELFWHVAVDPAAEGDMLPNVPSADPSQPSIYRVDLDPVDVPLLDPAISPDEGVQGAFEVYSLEPQEQGTLALAEAVLMALPAPETVNLLKTYVTSAVDAGDLRAEHVNRWTLGGTSPLPTVDDSTTYGLILDTTSCRPEDVAVAACDIHPGEELSERVRVEPGRQYRVRWHVVSPRQANLQAQMRLRTRTVRYSWSQKFEIGGAWAAGPINNALAQQALPGIGTANPDKSGTEMPGILDGGWYTMYFHPPNTIALTQPGPGVDEPSRRDLKLGADIIDSISVGPYATDEGGLILIDRIEVADFPALLD